MTAWLARWLLVLIPVMAMVIPIVFLLIHLLPDDRVSAVPSPDDIALQILATRRAVGLDRPPHEQHLPFPSRIPKGRGIVSPGQAQ